MSTIESPGRGISNFVTIEVPDESGPEIIIKRLRHPLTPEAEQSFNYFNNYLSNPANAFLRAHFPPTEIIRDESGAYYAQGLVHTHPGQENMASRENPALFDQEQINSLEELNDISSLMDAAIDFFMNSMYDPNSGLEAGLGWLLETHHPDSYVRGRLAGSDHDTIYFVDCHPILPARAQDAEMVAARFRNNINEISLKKFKTSLEKLQTFPFERTA